MVNIFIKINSVIYVSMLFYMLISSSNEQIVEAKKDVKIYIDNRVISISGVKPFIKDGRVLIPLRALQENLNSVVSWDSRNMQVRSQKNNGKERTKLSYSLNGPYVYKEYTNFQDSIKSKELVEKLDVPVSLVHNQSMVPLRSATESYGYNVKWKKSEYAVYVTTNKTIKPKKVVNQFEVDGNISKLDPIEMELFFLTNIERIKNGVKPLILDTENSKVAKIKSKDLHDYKYFEHTSPTLGNPYEMIKGYGIQHRLAGENLAAGFIAAEEVIEGWMNSPGHKKNLLRDDFERVGFGYFEGRNEYKRYYTQILTSK